MRVLLLGGEGFIGRHVGAALAARGHCVLRCGRRLETLVTPQAWERLLEGVDAAVNAVGILRERRRETYDAIYRAAPAALATTCGHRKLRFIHVSALGLHAGARSRFILAKLAGERAIADAGSDYSIVRPSLVDGDGGFGARWLRRMARWPVHFTPADALGRIAAVDARDVGEAIAVLCELPGAEWRNVELGGQTLRTMREYLAALRPAHMRPARRVTVPAWLARIASHLCDAAHFSPFSFGHLELMRRDNAPRVNHLPALLGRAPAAVGNTLTAPRRPARSRTAPSCGGRAW